MTYSQVFPPYDHLCLLSEWVRGFLIILVECRYEYSTGKFAEEIADPGFYRHVWL